MLVQPSRNLLQFLAEEHACELVSVHKHPVHIHLFTSVDGLFQAPIPYFETPHGLGTVSQLYLLVQYHLYAAMSGIMRLHQSEAYSSTRVAIDATLSAYRIIEKPELHALYQARDHSFQTIARFIKRSRKTNALSFPLAGELLAAWDHCSQFGSHADVSSFFYRMETLPDVDDASKQMLQFMFFSATRKRCRGRPALQRIAAYVHAHVRDLRSICPEFSERVRPFRLVSSSARTDG